MLNQADFFKVVFEVADKVKGEDPIRHEVWLGFALKYAVEACLEKKPEGKSRPGLLNENPIIKAVVLSAKAKDHNVNREQLLALLQAWHHYRTRFSAD